MKKAFTSFGDAYGDSGELAGGFPIYIQDDIHDWIRDVLHSEKCVGKYSSGRYYLTAHFNKFIQREFQRLFDSNFEDFYNEVSEDWELTACMLSLILKTIAKGRDSKRLMHILDHVNSEFCVRKSTPGEIDNWVEGGCDLEYRVSKAEKQQASRALDENDLLLQAWNHCYQASRKPNYEKAVSTCTDFLEGYLRDLFSPGKEKTLTVPQFIKSFEKKADEITFMGDTLLEDRMLPIRLLDRVSSIRGQHTTGSGKSPTADEARYVLHTTIYIWTLMNGAVSRD